MRKPSGALGVVAFVLGMPLVLLAIAAGYVLRLIRAGLDRMRGRR